MRPLIYDFQDDSNVWDIDDEWLVGDNILVSPVVKENATNRVVYLPDGKLWYNTELSLLYVGGGNYTIDVDNGTNLYFYKDGTIVARRDAFTQSATESFNDPLNLYVFLNSSNAASGTLYVDDGISFDYQKKQYIYREYRYVNGVLSFDDIDNDASFNGTITIQSIFLYRPPSDLNFKYATETQPIVEVLRPKDMGL